MASIKIKKEWSIKNATHEYKSVGKYMRESERDYHSFCDI